MNDPQIENPEDGLVERRDRDPLMWRETWDRLEWLYQIFRRMKDQYLDALRSGKVRRLIEEDDRFSVLRAKPAGPDCAIEWHLLATAALEASGLEAFVPELGPHPASIRKENSQAMAASTQPPPYDPAQITAREVKGRRVRLGSQGYVADKLGMHKHTLGKNERGEVPMRSPVLMSLALSWLEVEADLVPYPQLSLKDRNKLLVAGDEHDAYAPTVHKAPAEEQPRKRKRAS